MLLIRPVEMTDLPALADLAGKAGVGMTSLASDPQLLREKIEFSLSSFARKPDLEPERPEEALYFFVAEDLLNAKLAGTTAIKSQIGLKYPFYSYRLDRIVHASPQLGVHKIMPTLYLSNDCTGAVELASLLVAPQYLSGGHGRLLSKSRFLFLAQHQALFPERVIADMRGVSDEHGSSAFWNALGRHFFSMDFPLADRLSGGRSKAFIAELMPRNPIYVPLLPEDAQQVIGRVHPKTEAARALLETEGFRHRGYVDIFDAGPTLEAELSEILAIKRSRKLKVQVGEPGNEHYLLANQSWQNYRCIQAPAQLSEDGLMVSADCLAALQAESGDALWCTPLKALGS